jgi:transposase-like protein
VRLARELRLSLTGPDGLMKQLTKSVLDTALNEELTEHLGYAKGARAGSESGNVRNGSRPKTVATENTGQVEIEVPRDRAGTFEPQTSEVAAAPVERGRRGGVVVVCQGSDHWGDLGAFRRGLRCIG